MVYSVPDSSFPQKNGSGLSTLASLPHGFFQSRADIRTWGEAQVADPSIQPRKPHAPSTGSLPNYPPEAFTYFTHTTKQEKPSFVPLFVNLGINPNNALGPKLSVRNCNVQFPPTPPSSIGTPSYNFTDLGTYQMTFLPYIVSRAEITYSLHGFMCDASLRISPFCSGFVNRMR